MACQGLLKIVVEGAELKEHLPIVGVLPLEIFKRGIRIPIIAMICLNHALLRQNDLVSDF